MTIEALKSTQNSIERLNQCREQVWNAQGTLFKLNGRTLMQQHWGRSLNEREQYVNLVYCAAIQ